MSFLGAIGSFIMQPLYYAISVVLVGFHKLFSMFLPEESGGAWALSIVGLTVVIRALLIPLFVKQIKSSRNMQLLQPKVKELQKKYGHDRERLAQETMALYKESGTNPFASCLPIILQMPIFLALFRLLDQAAKKGKAHGVLTEELAEQFGNSKLFGVDLAGTFIRADGDTGIQIMALFFVFCMLFTTFFTQRQLMTKNMPESALTGQYAQQQKMLLYILPVVFAVGGVAFPIGVLIYWTISNLWTMGQQFYVIRNNPVPGTPAAKAKEERDRAKAIRKGKLTESEASTAELTETAEATEPVKPVRQQPKRQTRSQRQGGKKKPPSNRS